jgi:glycosyltransferase involved in cell wall biosynthesis
MRIGLATWSSRRVAGVEEYLALLIPALHEAGHEIALWHEVDEPLGRPLIPLKTAVHFCASDLGIDESIRAIRSWMPDVLYVHGLRDVAAEAKLLDVAPAVLFVHTYMGTCISGSKAFARPSLTPCDRRFGAPCLLHFFPRGCGGNSPLTMWKLYKRESTRLQLLNRYRGIVTHSHHMRDEMTGHGLPTEVIPFPVEKQPVDGMTSPGDTWRLLFAGRMHYLKGGPLLVGALPRVVAGTRRRVQVIFAGDGPDRADWEARARRVQSETGSHLAIEFTGWLPNDQIVKMMREADLLVVPSVWPEPLGSVGPMAAQHGVPAAAFSVGGISEWLTDGVSGHLAPADPPTASGLAEAILRCLSEPSHYAALRSGAQEMAARFAMDRHLPALMAALERAR